MKMKAHCRYLFYLSVLWLCLLIDATSVRGQGTNEAAASQSQSIELPHSANVESLAFSIDGKTLYTAGGSIQGSVGVVRAFDSTEWEPRVSRVVGPGVGYVQDICISPDGKRLATAGWSYYLARSSFGGRPSRHMKEQLKVWDTTDGRELASSDGVFFYEGTATAVAFSRDSKMLFCAGTSGSLSSRSARIMFWHRRKLAGEVTYGETILVRDTSVSDMAVSPDGSFLAIATRVGSISLFDIKTREERRKFANHGKGLTSGAISSDSATIATAGQDGVLQLWASQDGKLLHSCAGHRGGIWAIAFCPNKSVVATGDTKGEVILWDTANGTKLLSALKHEKQVTDLAFSPDGVWLASAGYDEKVQVWQASDALAKETQSPPQQHNVD